MVRYIYKITNPKGQIYIGQTNNPVRRKREYANCSCTNQRKIRKSIITYGWINHTFEVIHECTVDDVNMMERLFIKQFKSCSKGLNCNSGPKVKGMKPKKKRGKSRSTSSKTKNRRAISKKEDG